MNFNYNLDANNINSLVRVQGETLARYIELANDQLDSFDRGPCSQRTARAAINAIKSVVDSSQNFPVAELLKGRVSNLQDLLDFPEEYIEDPSHEDDFKTILFHRIAAKIHELESIEVDLHTRDSLEFKSSLSSLSSFTYSQNAWSPSFAAAAPAVEDNIPVLAPQPIPAPQTDDIAINEPQIQMQSPKAPQAPRMPTIAIIPNRETEVHQTVVAPAPQIVAAALQAVATAPQVVVPPSTRRNAISQNSIITAALNRNGAIGGLAKFYRK